MKITFLGNFEVDYSSEVHHAKTLEAMGHEVVQLQEGKVDTDKIRQETMHSDLFIWVHTHGWVTPGLMSMAAVLHDLKVSNIPAITYHLDLWLGLEREKDLETDSFYKDIGHFFATDKLMADWFNEHTDVIGHYLPAGVYAPEVEMLKGTPDKDVIFVGSKGYHPEYPYRPQLINWLGDTYGERFGHYSGEQEALGLRRGFALNQLYADTKVVVGDTLCINFTYPYYWSDRVYETLGRGGFLIMPHIEGLDEEFEDGKHLVTYEYGDFNQLKYLIDYYIEHDKERECIRKAGYEYVKGHYTYTHRWKQIFKELAL